MPDMNIQGLLGNPLLHMGLGLLSNNGKWGGLLTGMTLTVSTHSKHSKQKLIGLSYSSKR